MENKNNCRVCGYFMEDAPWGEDGLTPTYDICPCCGVEFGNEDYTIESTKRYRYKWLSDSIRFYEADVKPKNWSFLDQYMKVPKSYM